MIELKWNWAYYPYLDPPENQEESAQKEGYVKVVLKSEADKVIAHHKYKRCLANANVCAEKLYRQNLTTYGYEFYCKWLRRWLKIAAKFKEAKAPKEDK